MGHINAESHFQGRLLAIWKSLAPYDPAFAAPWYSFVTMTLVCFLGGGDRSREDYKSVAYGELAKRRFLEHYGHASRVLAKGNLLKFSLEDGLGLLCEFLGQEVPKGIIRISMIWPDLCD